MRRSNGSLRSSPAAPGQGDGPSARTLRTGWNIATSHQAQSTEHSYARLLKHHLLPTFADIPLTEIDRPAVGSWYRSIAPARPQARKHAYDLLRNILNAALDDELIDRNPVHIRGAGHVKRTGSTQPASLDELEALVDATPERFRLMVLLAAWCALRKGELSELRRSDVDTTRWVLKVRRGVGFVPGHTVVKGPKTEVGEARRSRA